MSAKSLYVGMFEEIRKIAFTAGLISFLDSRVKKNLFLLWVRSLFEIYNVSGLVALDLPWWTFKVTKHLEEFLNVRPETRVFEWGSGASTIWLAKRASTVVTIEHDIDFADIVKRIIPGNVELKVVPPKPLEPAQEVVTSAKSGFGNLDFQKYSREIEYYPETFDLIVIDGRVRQQCLMNALKKLAPGGLVLLDNVERKRYRKAVAQLGPEFSIRWFYGLTPALLYPTCTAIIQFRI